MEAKELRIGNLVNNAMKVTEIDSFGINGYYDEAQGGMNYNEYGCRLDEIKPIELTKEWLIKFGFENENRDSSEWNNYDSCPEHSICGEFNEIQGEFYFTAGEGIKMSVAIKYVHQLQNLYFALKGQELTLK